MFYSFVVEMNWTTCYFDIEGKLPYFLGKAERSKVASRDLLHIADKQLSKFSSNANKNLRVIYSKIASYSNFFYLLVDSKEETVLVPHDRFIGREDEMPLPVARLVESSTRDIYFSPEDKKFLGILKTRQPEILELTMYHINMRLWEQTGYFNTKSGKSFLEVKMEWSYDFHTCVSPTSLSNIVILTRGEIARNLEFLLNLLPREEIPETLDQLGNKSLFNL